METSNIIWGIGLCLLAVAILSANAYIFFMIYKHKKLQTRGNIFLLSLAVSDFSVALFNVPFTAASTFSPELRASDSTLCKASGVLEMTFLIASVFSVSAINFHRYIHIVHWSKYYLIFSIRRICCFVAAMWAAAVALSTPPLFGLSKICYKPRKSHCFVNWKENLGYTLSLMIVCFFVPVILMGYFYARIYYHRKSSKSNVKMMSEDQGIKSTSTKSISSAEFIPLSKSTRKLHIVMEHETIGEECANIGNVSRKEIQLVGKKLFTKSLINSGYGSYEDRGEVLEIEERNEVANRNSLDGNACVVEMNKQEAIEQSQKETSKVKNEEEAISVERSACKVKDSATVIRIVPRRKSAIVVSWKKDRRNSLIGMKDNEEEGFSIDESFKNNNNSQSLEQANPRLSLKTLIEMGPKMFSRSQNKAKHRNIATHRDMAAHRDMATHGDAVVRRNVATRRDSTTRRDATIRREREDRKLTLMCIIIVAVFFISWSPFVVTMFVESLTDINIFPVLDKATLVVGYMNSLANPIIYFYFNRSARRHLPRLMARCR